MCLPKRVSVKLENIAFFLYIYFTIVFIRTNYNNNLLFSNNLLFKKAA